VRQRLIVQVGERISIPRATTLFNGKVCGTGRESEEPRPTPFAKPMGPCSPLRRVQGVHTLLALRTTPVSRAICPPADQIRERLPNNPLRWSSAGRGWIVPSLLFALIFYSSEVRAEESPFDAFARWVSYGQGKWKGQVVANPDPMARPRDCPLEIRSRLFPISVHASPETPAVLVEQFLSDLEEAYQLLAETGWPLPLPEGNTCCTNDFDLYLSYASQTVVAAYPDTPVSWSLLDGSTSFAVIHPTVEPAKARACTFSALSQAALIGQDPAENESWRQATGAFVAWLATGEFGCNDAVIAQQQRPWLGWIDPSVEGGAGGALILAILSETQDGETGTFIRELWQFARQKSELGDFLRGSPDMYEVIARALKNSDQSIEQIAVDMAAARYFAGPAPRSQHAPYPVLRSLPPNAAVPVLDAGRLSDLPRHLPVSDQPLETFGSSYTIISTAGSPLPTTLNIWLRGETGALWSMIALRLDDSGAEFGRVSAPAKNDPNRYLKVDLPDGTAQVLIVVTNLIKGLPDADIDTHNPHSYQLILSAGE
jgi:hypothetical protein